MMQSLLKLILFSLFFTTCPRHVSAEVLGNPANRLTIKMTTKQPINTLKVIAKRWNKSYEKRAPAGLLCVAVIVLGTFALIAGLIDGRNVFVALLAIAVAALCLFILTRIWRHRDKKNISKPPTARPKK